MLIEVIGDAAMLEQTAEECVELAQACLKYARYLRGENKVHKPVEEIIENLHEEVADVRICFTELGNNILDGDKVHRYRQAKYERMRMRLQEYSKEVEEKDILCPCPECMHCHHLTSLDLRTMERDTKHICNLPQQTEAACKGNGYMCFVPLVKR